jgi:Lysyl-tRNA synthetase (class I)
MVKICLSRKSLTIYVQKPKSAKKLHFDIIPKTVDDYISHYNSYSNLDDNKKLDSPIWHIHSGSPKEFKTDINFNTLTNLVSVCNSNDKKVIWSFINKYDEELNPENNPEFDRLIDFALNYYNDFILPKKKYEKIDNKNKQVFLDIINLLENEISSDSSAEDIQTLLYEIGKKYEFDNLKDFFKLVYRVFLGQDQGPRLGSFIKLFGIRETVDYIKKLIDN